MKAQKSRKTTHRHQKGPSGKYYFIVYWIFKNIFYYTWCIDSLINSVYILGCLWLTRRWAEHYMNCKNEYHPGTDLMKGIISKHTNDCNSRQNAINATPDTCVRHSEKLTEKRGGNITFYFYLHWNDITLVIITTKTHLFVCFLKTRDC